MIATKKTTVNTLEPIRTVQAKGPIASLCFVGDAGQTSFDTKDGGDQDDGSSCSSTDSDLNFRCSSLRLDNNKQEAATFNQETPLTFSKRHLVTCQSDGIVHLWDLSKQQISCNVPTNRGGPGLAVRRVGSHLALSSTSDCPTTGCTFLCHTRDPIGTVSIHSLGRDDCPMERHFETHSQTFCAAAPCLGSHNLFALPSHQESSVVVVDTREKLPIAVVPFQSHGMVTSLAMSTTNGTNSGRPILACGLESGSIFFHDFSLGGIPTTKGECNLSKDPILSMDLAPSIASSADSVIAVAGMAGDAADMNDLPLEEQGRVALIKATSTNTSNEAAVDSNDGTFQGKPSESSWNIRIRSRLSTCRIDDETSGGKPGVSICRFQPGETRLFAVGGWDKRIRLFDRATGDPKAILRGYSNSVDCLDWAPDADESGLLATSAVVENRIHIWQCYGKSR